MKKFLSKMLSQVEEDQKKVYPNNRKKANNQASLPDKYPICR